MTGAAQRRLAAIGAATSIAISSMVFLAGFFAGEAFSLPDLVFGVVAVAGIAGVSLLGALIFRRTGNVIGWLFVVLPLGVTLGLTGETYVRAAFRPPTDLPAVSAAAWGSSVGAMLIVLPLPLLFLLFPTGRPSSPRWRWAIWVWAIGSVLCVLWAAFRPGEVFGLPAEDGYPSFSVDNPIGWLSEGSDTMLATAGAVLVLVSAAAGLVSLVMRFRRAHGDERQQLRWIAFVALLGALVFLALLTMDLLGVEAQGLADTLWFVMVAVFLLGLPAAVAVSILRYRLYDIDVVIRKTLVYAVLAGFITAVYVGVVVGVGAALGMGDSPNVALQIAATAIVATLFQPVRARAIHLANRVVYGRRATPYETLARFSERVGATYATEDVVPRIAHVIADGIGASRVDVWIRVGDELRSAATSPAEVDPLSPVSIVEGELPALGAGRAVPVRLGDELLGAVSAEKPAGEPFTDADERLLEDLAGQAGLVLSNVRMTAELEENLERIAAQARELRASRQRIVAAQDQERRRLERNIHDGAQQHLVALAVKLRLARATIARDPEKAREMLAGLQGEIDDALETLTTLALGIFPPLLEEEGLAAALAAQYTRSGLPVHLTTDGATRYPLEVEGAIYFCVLEALQNAAKYANATRIDVAIGERDGALRFEVRDDGSGFEIDPAETGTGLAGMRDRLSVLGGDASVESAPGRGTVVRGWLPVREEALALR